MPLGIHPYLLVVGVGSPIAVPCVARLGARRGEIRRLRSTDQRLSGSLIAKGFSNDYLYTNVMISRSASPIFPFSAGYSSNNIMSMGGTCTSCSFGRRGGYWRI
jgi:hypothetical protein